jgi:hypothetical protein
MCPGPCATQVGVAGVRKGGEDMIVGIAVGGTVGVQVGGKGTAVFVAVARPEGNANPLQPVKKSKPKKIITKRRRTIILPSKKKNAEGAFYPDPRL